MKSYLALVRTRLEWQGGTSIAGSSTRLAARAIAFGSLSAYVRAGKDKSGLGRAVWLLIEYNGHRFRVVTAYRPCGNRTKEEGKRGVRYTVWH